MDTPARASGRAGEAPASRLGGRMDALERVGQIIIAQAFWVTSRRRRRRRMHAHQSRISAPASNLLEATRFALPLNSMG